MTVFLERVYKENVTLGRLWFDQKAVFTLELPWRDNKPSISCIPEGIYQVEKTYSPKFNKDMWLVKNVPGRTGIRIHSASFVKDLEGCISPGFEQIDIDGDGIIDMKNSRKAMDFLNEYLPNVFTLEIICNNSLKF